MIHEKPLGYKPNLSETEKASNSYLMSLMAIVVGLPFPIVNLLATLIFYLANRKSTYFVRWHATQTLLSQFGLFILNSIVVWWTLFNIFNHSDDSVYYYIYLIFVVVLNVVELVFTIYSAMEVRKGRHIGWLGYSGLTDYFCKP